jgi:two-component system, cell cycle sensor histidine kinase and response regulator CckA
MTEKALKRTSTISSALLQGLLLPSLAGVLAGSATLFLLGGATVLPWSWAISAMAGLGGAFVVGLATKVLRIAGAGQAEQQPSFFDAVSDAQGFPFVVSDLQGRAIYANQPFLTLAQAADAKRLIGFDVLYAGHPDFAEPIYQLAMAAREGKSMHRDVRLAAGSVAPGGSHEQSRWLRLSVKPVTSVVGGLIKGTDPRAIWTLTDITSDRAHQEQAFSRLQFIITYLDHAPAGFFSTMPDGRVDYINATMVQWLGLDAASVQSGKLRLEDVLGADAARLLTAVEGDGKPSRTDRLNITVATRNGTPLMLELVNRVDFDRDGKALPARTMALQHVASPQGNTSDAGQRQLASNLLMAAPIGVAEVDIENKIVFANAAYLALSDTAKLGAKFLAPVLGHEVVAVTKALGEARDKAGYPARIDLNFAGDPPRAVHFTFVALPDNSGKVTVFAADRTESKSLEVQLGQAQKMQAVGQLASGIAHDFNNVLTPIIGFADLLLTKLRQTDPAFQDVQNIKQNANRAANLVRQLLAFSRKQTLQPKVLSLTDAMSDLDNLLGRVLTEKVKLNISHGRDLGLVLVDVHQFEQVVINLAVNARDAMVNGGSLNIRTRNLTKSDSQKQGHELPEGEYVMCEVEDTGTGIPKNILEKIWEPFFSTKEVGKGTGLGLSMVYGIIKQTGGFIYVDSVIGKGTTFKIYLPRHYPAPEVVSAEAKVVKPAPVREDFTGKGRILVVEDEDSVRAFAVRALTSRGFTVLEANSGEVGLEVIEADKDGFELILSDVVMPEMDGPTFLSELRKRGNKTKFMFMSGYAEDAFERNLENPDDFAFLQKPFSLKQLIEKVKDVMAS